MQEVWLTGLGCGTPACHNVHVPRTSPTPAVVPRGSDPVAPGPEAVRTHGGRFPGQSQGEQWGGQSTEHTGLWLSRAGGPFVPKDTQGGL